MPRLIGLQRKAHKDPKALEAYNKLLEEAQTAFAIKSEYTFEMTYPPLPVSEKREDILKLISENQVCIIQGDTGSGKTTQIPKMCMELGLGYRGVIGCTQPRRIAALSISDRLREETGEDSLIGHKIRFLEECPDNLHVKVMTDGILLQEFKTDRFLNQYSCIILDEAHERSLNIDILLGILKPLLKKRKDLKLIITSATIDAEHFSKFFYDAPIFKVDGRMFPVTVDYWDTDEMAEEYGLDSYSMVDATIDAIKHIQTQNKDNLLAFLPTEKDILEVEKGLEKLGAGFLVLPLYGRLSPQEQKRIFTPSSKTKIVLSTNIAETSLTIPGIAYVVDTGYARVSRFCAQTHIQGLPIEKISQASADQRKGRAGRVKPGTCIRLYSEENFSSREQYTEPEILRSNLANVLLQLMNTGINPHTFEFLSMPPSKSTRAGFKLLYELGALTDVTETGTVTAIGREMSRIPVDVTIARILIAAKEKNVLSEVVSIAAGISIQDPRIRPSDDRERSKADGLHGRFKDKRSDYISLLKLWDFINSNWQKRDSLNRLRKLCNENYLHFLRVREWRDLYEQFSRILKLPIELKDDSATTTHYDPLHQSILAGYLHNVAERHPEGHGYKIAKHGDAYIFPGSGIFNKKPQWLIASEVRETSRVYLVGCAQIEPQWILEYSRHLCNFSYYNIQWNDERGFVEAREKIIFKGFCISFGRNVNYESINPLECAEIFWREGIVTNPRQNFGFKKVNNQVINELKELEKKSRTWGLVPDEDHISAWYVTHFPEITSLKKLKKYIQNNGDKTLCFDAQTWMDTQIDALPQRSRETISTLKNLDAAYPSEITIGPDKATIKYQFDFGTDLDGACVRVTPDQVQYITPGLLFKAIPGWGRWVFNATFDSFKKSISDEMSPRKDELYSEWAYKIAHNPKQSIASLLFKTLNKKRALKDTISLPSKWEQFNTLHIRVKATKGQLPLDLTPSDTITTLSKKAFDLFYLTHWFEEKGKPFSFRLNRCYGQLPPRVEFSNTYLLPSKIQEKNISYHHCLSPLEYWYRDSLNRGSYELLYNKKFKIASDLISECKRVLRERIQAVAGLFTFTCTIPDQFLERQTRALIGPHNLASLDTKVFISDLEQSLTLPKLQSTQKKKVTSLQGLKSVSQSLDENSTTLLVHSLVHALLLEPAIFTRHFNAVIKCCNNKNYDTFIDVSANTKSDVQELHSFEGFLCSITISSLLGIKTIIADMMEVPHTITRLNELSSEYKKAQAAIRSNAKSKRNSIYGLFKEYGLDNVSLSSEVKKSLFSLEERGNSIDETLDKEWALDCAVNKALHHFFQKPHAFSEEFGQAENVDTSSLNSLMASFGRIK